MYRDQLAAVIHRDLDARAVDRHGMAAWHGRAKSLMNSTKATAYDLHRDRQEYPEEW